VYGLAFNRDGTALATGHHDGSARVWDAATGRPMVCIAHAHTLPVLGVAFNPSGERLASAGGGDNTVKEWDWRADTTHLLRTLTAKENIVRNPAYSPDGRRLVAVVATPGRVWTWDTTTGEGKPWPLPGARRISGIAIDSSDIQGLTAYVSIMGFSTASFPTSHVWQTTNGGFSWTDFTANLPNAPADAVVVDPAANGSPGRVYVATDVGVFWSFTSSANWTELGPPPNSGQDGYLPNVAVTELGIFTRSDSTKLLRASTYGRGVWEFPLTPDFSLSISNTPIIVFAGQVLPVFTGTITALGGYKYQVNLSCTPVSTCVITPSFVNPPGPPP
jgi:hypothetical protein